MPDVMFLAIELPGQPASGFEFMLPTRAILPSSPRRNWFSIPREDLENGALWFTMALSGFVLFEPAPFEFMVLALIGIWLLSGLHIPRTLTLIVAITGMLTVTGLLAALLSTTLIASGRHVIISIFLYALTIGLAAFVARNPHRTLPIIISGYTVAALIACAASIIGYFGLVDGAAELFLRYDRARGTMKDPNVYGPFLVLPMVYIFVRHLIGEDRLGSLQSAILAILAFGLLLSFSRGAWANVVFTAAVSTYLLFVSAKTNSLRLKVIGLTVFISVISVALLVFALSFDAISDLMSTRGQLIQNYDTTERFAGAQISLDVILKNPLGIGAYSFKEFHEAEPHNVYLYSFLIGGWIGGFAYIALVLSTIYVGFHNAFTEGNLRPLAIVLFATFLVTAFEGLIIDSDHWRHFYILIACNWGLYTYQRAHHSTRTRAQDAPFPMNRMRVLSRRSALRAVNTIGTIKPASVSASTIDLSFKSAMNRKKNWRRKLGNASRTQTESHKKASATLNGFEGTETKPGISARELRARYVDSMRTREITKLPPLDRSQFGIRPSEALPDRNAFGRRQTERHQNANPASP